MVPTGLTFGELAVNITDKKLFVGGITGNTIELLSGGNNPYLDGVSGNYVSSLNGLTGAVTLAQGTNITLSQVGNTITIDSSGAGGGGSSPRLATTSLTGVAYYDSNNFTVGVDGKVSITNGTISNSQLANSSITIKAGAAEAGQPVSLGGSFSITGTPNQTYVTRTGTQYTIGIPNDIVIPGNLTVNGTVVTANVDSFVVEDPLFMLGTGNAADVVDLGFYALYTSSGRNFTGFYRDATDGKYKLFTGLTGAAEPSTTVNDAAAGYSVATLVAKIDGGTF